MDLHHFQNKWSIHGHRALNLVIRKKNLVYPGIFLFKKCFSYFLELYLNYIWFILYCAYGYLFHKGYCNYKMNSISIIIRIIRKIKSRYDSKISSCSCSTFEISKFQKSFRFKRLENIWVLDNCTSENPSISRSNEFVWHCHRLRILIHLNMKMQKMYRMHVIHRIYRKYAKLHNI